jgi:hypothetical protein
MINTYELEAIPMYIPKFLRTYIVVGTSSFDVLSFGNSFLKKKRSGTNCMAATLSTSISSPGRHICLRNGDSRRNRQADTGRPVLHFTKMHLVFNEVMISQDRRKESEMKMFEQRSVAQNLRS